MPEYNPHQQRDHIIGQYVLETCVQLENAIAVLRKLAVYASTQEYDCITLQVGELLSVKTSLSSEFNSSIEEYRKTGHYRAHYLIEVGKTE